MPGPIGERQTPPGGRLGDLLRRHRPAGRHGRGGGHRHSQDPGQLAGRARRRDRCRTGFGAQRIVQDLLAGFFIITEKQYGFGDLVQLTLGSSNEAMGTVEDVTLRVTKLRTPEGGRCTPSPTGR